MAGHSKWKQIKHKKALTDSRLRQKAGISKGTASAEPCDRWLLASGNPSNWGGAKLPR